MADASLHSAAKSNATFLQRIFGLDTRSLAIFRIVVGVLILIDLYDRSLYLTDFYTDDGFLTRALVNDYLGQMKPPVEDAIPSTMPWPFWSFHLLSGDVWVAQMLFGLQALLAILLIVGWKTRLLTVLNWLLLISLHARNPIVLNSGDTILRMMLFWGIFLPLGHHWSLDRWRKKATQAWASSVVSVASAAFIIQLCTMYWFTGWAKMNPTWLDGEAIHNVLNLNIVCRPLGKYLLEYPDLLGTMCHVTLWMEFGAPFLLFIPWKTAWIRTGLVTVFFGFHLGIVLTMTVGLFSAISITCWLALLPSEFWDSRWLRKIIGLTERHREMVPEYSTPATALPPKSSWIRAVTRVGSFAAQGSCAIILVYILLWNIWRIQPNDPQLARVMPVSIRPFGQTLMLAQEFKMFDTPPALDYWFMYEGQLSNGEKVELFTGRPIPMGKPDDLYSRYIDHRWRRLHVNFLHPDYALLRQPLTEYLVNKWNQSHSEDEQVTRCFFRCYQESTGKNAAAGNLLSDTWVDLQLVESDPFTEMLKALENGGSILP